MTNHDYADAEVKGITRYLPDRVSVSLFMASIAVPAGLYISAPQSVIDLLPNPVSTNGPLTLLALCFAIAWLILIVLSLHLALMIHHSKHRVMRHYKTYPESMDLSNLIKRFSFIHWLSLSVIFLSGVALGYYL